MGKQQSTMENLGIIMTNKLVKLKSLREEILTKVTEYHDCEKQIKDTPEFSRVGKINYAGRVYDDDEIKMAVEASLDFWLTAGRFTEEFESGLGDFLGIENVLTVNSGSSANLVAFSTLTSQTLGERRIKPGDEVITVAAGFPTTVNPIIQFGAIPVFVDIELGTYAPSLDVIEKAISNKTKAVMIAHAMGVPYELDKIRKLCDDNNLWLIEDNCDALGSKYDGRYTGTFGDLSTLSFYPAHHITMGEGGAVMTNNDELARIAKSFRDWGRDCYCAGGENNTCGKRFTQQLGKLPYGYDHKYVYSHIGYNLKITEMQAAIGCAQLRKLDAFISKRKYNHSRLSQGLSKHSSHIILHTAPENSDPSWFGYVVTTKPGSKTSKSELIDVLEKSGIETRNLFAGNLLKQPAYQDIKCRISGSLKNTDIVLENTFFIGVYPGLTDEMLDQIIEAFDRALS